MNKRYFFPLEEGWKKKNENISCLQGEGWRNGFTNIGYLLEEEWKNG